MGSLGGGGGEKRVDRGLRGGSGVGVGPQGRAGVEHGRCLKGRVLSEGGAMVRAAGTGGLPHF